jgi:hypothetical protein
MHPPVVEGLWELNSHLLVGGAESDGAICVS